MQAAMYGTAIHLLLVLVLIAVSIRVLHASSTAIPAIPFDAAACTMPGVSSRGTSPR